jgi:hypothetical protein
MRDIYDECNKPMCASFAHEDCFTHSAIMDVCVPVSIPPRDFDLCKYSYHELAYLHGLDAPNYPVPAIPLQVRWIGDISNPFYGLEIRDNNQWANMTWSPDYGLEYRPREHWQCEFCGCIHPGEPCPY